MNKLTGGQALVGSLRATDDVTAKDINATTVQMTVGAEASNAITVACQLVDGNGAAVAVAKNLAFYLATDAAGQVPASTAPNGGLAAGTDGAIVEWTANLSGRATFEADGDLDVVLTDSGTPTFYLVFVLPNGDITVSDEITFA